MELARFLFRTQVWAKPLIEFPGEFCAIPDQIVIFLPVFIVTLILVLGCFYLNLKPENIVFDNMPGKMNKHGNYAIGPGGWRLAIPDLLMILLPLTAPALVTTGLLAFISAWNKYLFALTFTSIQPSARTAPVAIALFTGQNAYQIPFGEIRAAAIIVRIPLILLVLFFQQRIVAGLTSCAVKG